MKALKDFLLTHNVASDKASKLLLDIASQIRKEMTMIGVYSDVEKYTHAYMYNGNVETFDTDLMCIQLGYDIFIVAADDSKFAVIKRMKDKKSRIFSAEEISQGIQYIAGLTYVADCSSYKEFLDRSNGDYQKAYVTLKTLTKYFNNMSNKFALCRIIDTNGMQTSNIAMKGGQAPFNAVLYVRDEHECMLCIAKRGSTENFMEKPIYIVSEGGMPRTCEYIEKELEKALANK